MTAQISCHASGTWRIRVAQELTYCDDVCWRMSHDIVGLGDTAGERLHEPHQREAFLEEGGGLASIDWPARRMVEFAADDLDDLEALYNELYGTPGLVVEAMSSPLAPGDQGTVLDFLTVACSGGAITVLLQIIKTLVESRDTRFVLKVRCGKDHVEVNAANVEEALPAIRALINGP
jgi:hypothetical protein